MEFGVVQRVENSEGISCLEGVCCPSAGSGTAGWCASTDSATMLRQARQPLVSELVELVEAHGSLTESGGISYIRSQKILCRNFS